MDEQPVRYVFGDIVVALDAETVREPRPAPELADSGTEAVADHDIADAGYFPRIVSR